MDDSRYDKLKLKNQLCFPLYAASRETMKLYRPYLEPFDLTYTQYITLMVVWEKRNINVKELGNELYLDSGTLTPVLKCLESKGYVRRYRCPKDERCVRVEITKKGDVLREQLLFVPDEMAKCVHLTTEETLQLYQLLYKLLDMK